MNLRLRLNSPTFAVHVKKSIHKYLNYQASFQRLICLSQFCTVIFLYCISVGGAPQSSPPEILIQNGHTGKLTAIAYSPIGTLFVTGGNDYIVKLWDEKNGQLQNNFVGHSGIISSLAFSRNGELVVSGSHDGTVRLWSVKSGKQVRVFVGHKSHVLSVAFSPDSKFIASAGGSFEGTSDSSIRIWETQTGRLLYLLEGHKQRVNSIAFSPDGELLASGGEDAEIKIWSKTGKILYTFENINDENPQRKPGRPGV